MNQQEMLEIYAKNIVEAGLNIKKGEVLLIKCPVWAYELARIVAKCAYENGAKKVKIDYRDDYVDKEFYLYADEDVLTKIYKYEIESAKYLIDEKAALLSITSPIPRLMEGVDAKKIQMRNKASMQELGFLREYTMSNKGKWCVVAYPNQEWANIVFKDKDNAYDLLKEAIMKASRVSNEENVLANHMKSLEEHKDILNNLNLKSLIFKNNLGTDLKIDLVEDHIWGGGGEYSQDGQYFMPNIPTEEVFTMPHSHGVNGRVYSTKPLN